MVAIRSSRWLVMLENAGWLLLAVAPFGASVYLHAPRWVDATIDTVAVLGLITAYAARHRWRRLGAEVRQRLETLDRCTPDLLFETDARGVITFASDCAVSIFGREPSDIIGRSLRTFTEGAIPILDGPLTTGDAMVIWNTQWRHTDGEQRLLTTVLSPIHRGATSHGMRGVVRDPRDRLENERSSARARSASAPGSMRPATGSCSSRATATSSWRTGPWGPSSVAASPSWPT